VTHHDAFLLDVHENPDDPTPRRIYADWLEDQGDAESLDKAKFIRGHLDLEQLSDEDERRGVLVDRLNALIRKWTRSWVGPFAGVFRYFADDDRYVDQVRIYLGGDGCLTLRIDQEEFLTQRERLFCPLFFSPYLRVGLDYTDRLERQLFPDLVGTKELDRVTGIAFYNSPPIDLPRLQTLLASPHWRRLRRLNLSHNELTDEAAAVLIGCPHLGRVNSLDLSHNQFTASAAEALLGSPQLPGLKRLFFGGNDLTLEEEADLTARFGERISFHEGSED
jgi:uncharacterized protein (TIGR02996 family)